jgi:hypothetical protein
MKITVIGASRGLAGRSWTTLWSAAMRFAPWLAVPTAWTSLPTRSKRCRRRQGPRASRPRGEGCRCRHSDPRRAARHPRSAAHDPVLLRHAGTDPGDAGRGRAAVADGDGVRRGRQLRKLSTPEKITMKLFLGRAYADKDLQEDLIQGLRPRLDHRAARDPDGQRDDREIRGAGRARNVAAGRDLPRGCGAFPRPCGRGRQPCARDPCAAAIGLQSGAWVQRLVVGVPILDLGIMPCLRQAFTRGFMTRFHTGGINRSRWSSGGSHGAGAGATSSS